MLKRNSAGSSGADSTKDSIIKTNDTATTSRIVRSNDSNNNATPPAPPPPPPPPPTEAPPSIPQGMIYYSFTDSKNQIMHFMIRTRDEEFIK